MAANDPNPALRPPAREGSTSGRRPALSERLDEEISRAERHGSAAELPAGRDREPRRDGARARRELARADARVPRPGAAARAATLRPGRAGPSDARALVVLPGADGAARRDRRAARARAAAARSRSKPRGHAGRCTSRSGWRPGVRASTRRRCWRAPAGPCDGSTARTLKRRSRAKRPSRHTPRRPRARRATTPPASSPPAFGRAGRS